MGTAARSFASICLPSSATGLSPEKMAAEEAAEASLAGLSPERRQPGLENDDDEDEENPEGDGETAALSEGRGGAENGRVGGQGSVVGARPSVRSSAGSSCCPSSRVRVAAGAEGGGRAPCGGAGGSPVRV